MISVTWIPNKDRDLFGREYLECRNEEFGNEPRENRTDVVKVYFCSGTDIILAKSEKLEMAIARQIFSNREKYGKVLTAFLNRSKYGSSVDATLDVYPNAIHFRTGTDAEIYNEYWPINLGPINLGPINLEGAE